MKRLILFGLFFLVGCGAKRELSESPFQQNDTTYQITLLFDMSGSFAPMMAEEGKAYQFALQIVDRYFRDRIGMDDELIIAVISGSDRAPIWQGQPLDLRKDYPSAKAFRDALVTKAENIVRTNATDGDLISPSNVHECITNTLDYVLTEPGIADGRVKASLFILSDMLDGAPEPEKSRQVAVDGLSRFGEAGGTVGIYYCDQSQVADWRKILPEAGIKHWRVESGIVSRPMLPSFE